MKQTIKEQEQRITSQEMTLWKLRDERQRDGAGAGPPPHGEKPSKRGGGAGVDSDIGYAHTLLAFMHEIHLNDTRCHVREYAPEGVIRAGMPGRLVLGMRSDALRDAFRALCS